MRRLRSRVASLVLPAGLLVGGALASCGGDGPPVIGDAPVVMVHTDQADIDEGRLDLEDLIERGRALMVASFNTLDGAGRPESTGLGVPRPRREAPDNFNRISGPDSGSCFACHNMPRAGGGGDNVANAFVLAQRLPLVNFDGGDGDGSSSQTLKTVGNERNTLGMFGSGFIELLAREMTADLHAIRDEAIALATDTRTSVFLPLTSKGVSFGWITALPDGSVETDRVEGVDTDLVVKPFHQKGVDVSLRSFTTESLNHHHGMQPVELFGDGIDADGDGVVNEVTRGDVTALVMFQATLPVPGQVLPGDGRARQAVEQGRELFDAVGCAVCHVPELPLNDPVFTEPNPLNPPGNLQVGDVSRPFRVDLTSEGPGPHLKRGEDGVVMVPAFTDLKRHRMGDALDNEALEQNGVPTDSWLTRKLWGMASEPPFLHHGRATLISEAVLAHGGEARESRDAFRSLSHDERAALIEFLKSLQVLPEGEDDLVITARE